MNKITSDVHEVLYLHCGERMAEVAKFCGRPAETTNFVVTFEEFQEMENNNMLTNATYFDNYIDSNIVEIVAIF